MRFCLRPIMVPSNEDERRFNRFMSSIRVVSVLWVMLNQSVQIIEWAIGRVKNMYPCTLI